jgi:hypothetical protein
MPRYKLRTLLILLTVGPPMLAGAWSMYSDYVERQRREAARREWWRDIHAPMTSDIG